MKCLAIRINSFSFAKKKKNRNSTHYIIKNMFCIKNHPKFKLHYTN